MGAQLAGLGGAAQAHILRLAHGNPKILTAFPQVMALDLPGERWCWENGDPAHDLTEQGSEVLRQLPVEHEKILKLLLENVRVNEPIVYEALRLSSHQGLQFLNELTEAVARELAEPPAQAIPPGLQRAHHPHNLIAPLAQARVPASESREARVCALLEQRHGDKTREEVRAALRAVLLRSLHSDQMAAHPEAGRLNTRLLAFLEDADARRDPAAARPRLIALAECLAWLQRQWEFRAAALLLPRLDAVASFLAERGGTRLTGVPFPLQHVIIKKGFLSQTNYAAVLRWCDSLLLQLPSGTYTAEGLGHRYVASVLRADAIVGLRGAKGHAEARQSYRDVVAIIRRHREQFGDSPQALRDESVSRAKLALVSGAGGSWAEAANVIGPVLEAFKHLLERYGATPRAEQDYLWAVKQFIDWCEKSGQAKRPRPLREWLERSRPDVTLPTAK